MPEAVFLGFDFGYKRIGLAVGQKITGKASPLATIFAKQGVPNWDEVRVVIKQWRPEALIVGLPTCIDGSELYTTTAAQKFAAELHERFLLPVHLVDERLSTVAAREELYAEGGYRKIKKTEVDSIAACVILEQWLQTESRV
ncbi:MAG: Holliday junction DNA helicase RuvA [Legionellales bacterium RIFCSPHIGHO2_12_FULL_35_11]|nr:MAG: Holliday junction DNA helicase RuvA [Legionellales bacterium RIFCSPHIGHO2_12_FULL_35_11]